jgi:hypothetical protein
VRCYTSHRPYCFLSLIILYIGYLSRGSLDKTRENDMFFKIVVSRVVVRTYGGGRGPLKSRVTDRT